MTVGLRTVDVTMPQLGETVAEGTVTRWLKQVGDQVAEGEPLFEVSTDKVDTEVPAAASGRLVEIRAPVDATVPVGAVLAVIETAAPPLPSVPKARPNRHVASPRARRLLRELGLDPASVRGSGPGGRVHAADVAAVGRPEPAGEPVRFVRQSGFVAMDVDFHAIDRAGFAHGYLSFVAYAVLDALRRFPQLNTGADPGVGVHLAVDDAVIARADDLRFEALARVIDDPPRTDAAATFWLRHPGRYGTTFSRAALPQSAVASLALDAVRPTPVAVPTTDGYALAVHPVGVLSLTFDAAAVDEATAAQFLGRVRETLEGAGWLTDVR